VGLVYLAALVLGLGAILVPVLVGAHGADAPTGDAPHDALALHGADAAHAEPAFALFVSLRFWAFASLGFGLSGGLIHVLALAGAIATIGIAAGAGFASGLFAALVFRALRRGTTGAPPLTSDAVGRVGRVLVACARGKVGQVRVELGGRTVDLAATTSADLIPRGASAVIVEARPASPVHVEPAPPELAP
jgi:hypothetical protein